MTNDCYLHETCENHLFLIKWSEILPRNVAHYYGTLLHITFNVEILLFLFDDSVSDISLKYFPFYSSKIIIIHFEIIPEMIC